jgi:hypothetical protein
MKKPKKFKKCPFDDFTCRAYQFCENCPIKKQKVNLKEYKRIKDHFPV